MTDYKIGADPFPPYQYFDKEGNMRGSDYETINNVILKMGKQAEYILDNWDDVEQKLINKEIDIAFQVQKTPEREKKYYFSNLLRNAITTVVTVGDNSLEVIDDIKAADKKLAVIKGYKYGDIIDALPDKVKIFCENQKEQLECLINNKADFAVVDLGVFEYQLKNMSFKDFKILRHLDFDRPLYVVFNNSHIRDVFNSYM